MHYGSRRIQAVLTRTLYSVSAKTIATQQNALLLNAQNTTARDYRVAVASDQQHANGLHLAPDG